MYYSINPTNMKRLSQLNACHRGKFAENNLYVLQMKMLKNFGISSQK